MPRGRMLSKKISYDEKVAHLSLKAALFYTWCIPHLDVKGRIYANPCYLKGVVIPYRKIFTPSNIQHCINEMEKNGLIVTYGNSRKYMEFKGFTKNQTIAESKEAPSEIPAPTLEQLQSNSRLTPEEVNTSKVNISKVNIYVEVAKATFDHYIKIFNKNKEQYQFTSLRKNKVSQRAREIQVITNDIAKTKDLLFIAINNRRASKFHMGENEQGKKYIDFVDHIFKSQEYTEKLIFEEKKVAIKKPEYIDDMLKHYRKKLKSEGKG